jgi:hypothetical protein
MSLGSYKTLLNRLYAEMSIFLADSWLIDTINNRSTLSLIADKICIGQKDLYLT